jgi:four helix bundle protein
MTTERSASRPYTTLICWQRAVDFAVDCHRIARRLPARDARELASQLRRASVSIPSNIAEGNGRSSRRDYLRFLAIANGSLMEAETLLILITRLGLAPALEIDVAMSTRAEVGRLLGGLMRRLRAAEPPKEGSAVDAAGTRPERLTPAPLPRFPQQEPDAG